MSASMPMRMVPPRTYPVAVRAGPDTKTRAASTPSLADVAFGAACNSHGEAAVALNVTIAFLDAVTPDATLIAEGREKKQGRRAGFYEIEVTTEDGAPVALAHCVAHRVGR